MDTTSAGTVRRKCTCSIRRTGLIDRPAWVTSITDPTELKQVLRDHINAVMGRYGKDMYAIDVVNERE